jgi:hypothetical protein
MRVIKFRYWDKQKREFWDEPKELNHFVFSYGHNYSDAGEDEDRIIFGGQYTGMNDKNGKEIYEGDLVKVTWEDIYNKNAVIIEIKWANGYHFPNSGAHTVNSQSEIIGNIYENPGLLAVAPPCP